MIMKKTKFFFRTQFLLIDKIFENKRGLELLTSRSLGYETSLEKFLYIFVIYYLTKFDDVVYKKVLELLQKLYLQICAIQFMTS